jgi:hypothetical protein
VHHYAERHLAILRERGEASCMSPCVIQSILARVPAMIKQAHGRIIGGRNLANKDEVLSLCDADIQVIKCQAST